MEFRKRYVALSLLDSILHKKHIPFLKLSDIREFQEGVKDIELEHLKTLFKIEHPVMAWLYFNKGRIRETLFLSSIMFSLFCLSMDRSLVLEVGLNSSVFLLVGWIAFNHFLLPLKYKYPQEWRREPLATFKEEYKKYEGKVVEKLTSCEGCASPLILLMVESHPFSAVKFIVAIDAYKSERYVDVVYTNGDVHLKSPISV